MGRNIVQKILDKHMLEGKNQPGSEAGIRIDQTLTQDATGTMAYLQFEALGFERVKTELSVSYVDHNTVQQGFENADDHRYLQSVAEKYGIMFSRPGNGICHQVHLERFAAPGKTLLGSDSHTPTAGGMGMIAIGAGGLDVAAAMGGKPFYLTYPEVIKIELKGGLKPWVSAKDVILRVLEILSTKGNVGYVVEYGGEGVKSLNVPQRSTITNMGAELGVTTSVFPSDERTEEFLSAQKREDAYAALSADDDAEYARVITIDLSRLEPMAAAPHSPGNVVKVRDIKGKRVDQVCIGSCTNGSLRDIMLVAGILRGEKIDHRISFGLSCGSRQVLNMASRNGAIADIVEAGGRILETVCGFCIGNSFAPASNALSLRTSNRNFFGRSGTTSADVYLVSPETAAASALAGEIVDPCEYLGAEKYDSSGWIDNFMVDDSMIVPPSGDPDKVEVIRGANIGEPPSSGACTDRIDGVVTIKVGDKITTDHIMPAGSRLKYRSNIPKYSEYVFENTDPDFYRNSISNRDKGIDNIIVAGESYGQGSSREHAAICPMFLGVKLVAAKSIERIHSANLVNFGIIPAVFKNPSDYDSIGKDSRVIVENVRKSIDKGESLILKNIDNGKEIELTVNLSDRGKKSIIAGGFINVVRDRLI